MLINDGIALLHLISEKGLSQLAIKLIEKFGKKWDIPYEDGISLLDQACKYWTIDGDNLMLTLLEKGKEWNIPYEKSIALLESVIRSNLSQASLKILEKFSEESNIPYEDGIQLLQLACIRKMARVCNKLLEIGAQWNIPKEKGVPLFEMACKNGLDGFAFKLLETCEKWDVPLKHYINLFDLALKNDLKTLAPELFEKCGNSFTPNEKVDILMLACYMGINKLALTLLNNNPNLDISEEQYTNLLLHVCKKGMGDVALELLKLLETENPIRDLGLELVETTLTLNKEEYTEALNQAREEPNTELFMDVAPKLSKTKKTLHISKKISDTALHWACKKGMTSVVEKLIEKGVDVHVKSRDGVQALREAVYHQHLDIVQLLTNKGADVNYRSREEEKLPLLLACENGNSELVLMLLKNGAKVSLKRKVPYKEGEYYDWYICDSRGKGLLSLANDNKISKEAISALDKAYSHKEKHEKEIVISQNLDGLIKISSGNTFDIKDCDINLTGKIDETYDL